MASSSSTSERSKPGLFTDIGKKAKDLLHKGYTTGHMLFFSHVTSAGATLSTTSIMTEGAMLGAVSTSFKGGGIKTDVSLSTLNQATAETTCEDLVPGLKLSLSVTVPNASNLGKMELAYQRGFAAMTGLMKGLNTTPALECTVNFGSGRLCAGGLVSYNTATNAVTTTTAGLGYNAPPLSLALLCNPTGDTNLTMYCLHEVNPNVSWAVQTDYQCAKGISSSSVGGLYKLDPQTSLKAKINTGGLLSALLEYEPKPLVTIGLCVQVHCRALDKEKPKVGFSVTVLSV